MDQEYLEQLRANAEEVRQELAERELAALTDHDAIMAQRAAPPLVRKTKMDARVKQTTDDIIADDINGDGQLDNAFMEAVAEAMAEQAIQLRADCAAMLEDAVAPLRERIATLEGQLSMLTGLLGADKAFEATETIRKLRVQR
jgi:hypothetical protein